MIPGNPGLVEYYRDFLGDLTSLLAKTAGGRRYEIAGSSLAGFEVNGAARSRPQEALPYDLQQQVSHVQGQVRDVVRRSSSVHPAQSLRPASRRMPVILMGHSIGAYILLEIIARQQAKQRLTDNSSLEADADYEIVGGICLFPTVVDIAKSPRGRIAAVSLSITSFLPASLLTNLL